MVDAFPMRPKLCFIFGTARRAIPTDVGDMQMQKLNTMTLIEPRPPDRRVFESATGKAPLLDRAICNSALGGEINGETSQPVSAFIILARYRCQSGATMRIGRGLQGGTTWIV